MFEPGKPIVTLTDAAATQVRALMDAADNDIIGLASGSRQPAVQACNMTCNTPPRPRRSRTRSRKRVSPC